MSEDTSFAEFDGQHVELLPARTVLSLLGTALPGTDGTPGTPGIPGKGGISGSATGLPLGDNQYSVIDRGGIGSSTSGSSG